jgi:uncharacterized protein YbjT (DUF2867 family)
VKALLEEGHEGRAYELTGSEALDYAEVAAILGEVLGRPIAYVDPSPLAFWRRSRRAGVPAAFVTVMLGLYTVARLGLAARVTPEMQQLLGRPPITVRRFAEDHAAVWT